MSMKTFILGESAIIGDPCYGRENLEHAIMFQVRVMPGLWCVVVEKERNSTMLGRTMRWIATVVHGDMLMPSRFELHNIGVDSGQAGIFSDDIFPTDEARDFDDKTSFYGLCCEATIREDDCGVILERGFVSSSGYGDGSYPLKLGFDTQGRCITIGVDFDPADPDDEDEEF